ncbi:hypothetical protein D5278_13690 [bacterium 1XD21-13]|nr:hypothetical protein [bacterium 1XD21-13]
MADGKTLHELKVAIRVALGGYKKDMGSVKAETKKMREAVDGETAKITRAMGKVSTEKAKKELEQLTGQLNRQKERITQQENVIQSLRNKYEGLVSGMTQDKGVTGLEKQLKSAEKEFAAARQKMNELLDQYEVYEAAAKSGGSKEAFRQISEQVDTLEPKYEALGRKVDELKKKLEQVRMSPETSTSAQELMARIDAETAKLERLKNEAGTTREKLDAVLNSKSPPGTGTKLTQILAKLKGLASSARSSTSAVTKGFSQVNKGVGRLNSHLKGMFLSVVVFQAMRTALSGFRSYLGSCLSTNREFAASLNTIKTNLQVSFASIYTAALPAINALMRALAALSGMMANVISRIFGKTYSESLKTAKGLNAASKAAGGAGKQKQLMGFDEINRLEDSDSSGGAGGVNAGLSEAEGTAGKLRDILSTIFGPFKEAWDAKGAGVIEAARFAVSGIKGLLADIGKSFAEVWTNGTGLEVCSRILDILGNILLTVGNIAVGFDNAWKFNDTGTQIVQKLFDLLVLVLGALNQMSEATAVWSAGLDFSPILQAFDGLLEAVKPLTSTICDGLVWMYENVLLPFASWTIEDVIPAFFDLLASAITAVNAVLQSLQPLGSWLWESFLQPLAAWTGGAICTILETLAGWLEAIGKWISEHQAIMEVIAVILGSVAAAVKLVNAVILIWNTIAAVATGVTTALGAAMAFLTSPIGIVIAIISALIAVIVLLVKNWDTVKAKANEVWSAVQAKFQEFDTFLTTIFSVDWTKHFGIFGEVLNGFMATVKSIWQGIKQVFNGMITFIKGVFSGNWRMAWEGVKQIFSGVMSGLGALIKAPLNAVISLVNAAISGINRISIDIPDWVPLVGGKHFGPNIPKIPYLAAGGVVTRATPAVIGENGAEAVMPLERNTGWIRQLAGRIHEYGSGGITKEELYDTLYRVLEIMFQKYMQFYIGDEDIARHANRGNASLNRRYSPQEV